jgi:protein TonB
MFEDATFHSRSIQSTKTPKWMLLTLTLNLTLVAALVTYPLINPEGLPARVLQRALYAPPPPLAPPPQPRTSQPVSLQTATIRNPFAAPPTIPTATRTDLDSAPPPAAYIDMNKSTGGVSGADSLSTSLFHTYPPPAVHPAPPRSVPVSSGVIEGYILYRATPLYPVIARTVGVSGSVALAATISKSGAIQNLRVVSGHPMLRQAALDAVEKWRYRPYILNGQPVEVETTINVVFSLGNR